MMRKTPMRHFQILLLDEILAKYRLLAQNANDRSTVLMQAVRANDIEMLKIFARNKVYLKMESRLSDFTRDAKLFRYPNNLPELGIST